MPAGYLLVAYLSPEMRDTLCVLKENTLGNLADFEVVSADILLACLSNQPPPPMPPTPAAAAPASSAACRSAATAAASPSAPSDSAASA